MMDFVETTLCIGLLCATLIFASYAAAAYAFFNSRHGNLAAWTAALAKLRVGLPADRVVVESSFAFILAPLPAEAQDSLSQFLAHHRTIGRVHQRLLLMKAWRRFAGLSVIVGLALGIMLSAPLLFGSEAAEINYTVLVPTVVFGSSSLFIMLFNFPQVQEWNQLQDASGKAAE